MLLLPAQAMKLHGFGVNAPGPLVGGMETELVEAKLIELAMEVAKSIALVLLVVVKLMEPEPAAIFGPPKPTSMAVTD